MIFKRMGVGGLQPVMGGGGGGRLGWLSSYGKVGVPFNGIGTLGSGCRVIRVLKWGEVRDNI